MIKILSHLEFDGIHILYIQVRIYSRLITMHELGMEPPQDITFRKKIYNYYGMYDRRYKIDAETEALHVQGIKTHIMPWNTTHYVLYAMENRK